MPKPKRRRYIYTEHSDEQVLAAISMAVPEGGIMWDFFSSVGLEPVSGANEFERGKCEGRRELAGQILSMAMAPSVTEFKVRKNVQD